MTPAARLTPKVRSAARPDRMDRESFTRMSAAQAQALTAIARGDVVDPEASPIRAVRALAREAKPDVAVDALVKVVSRTATDVDVRVVAATELGVIGSPRSAPALLRAARDEDVRVRAAAIRSLGVFGGREVLKKLDDDTTDAATRRELVMARALIAHREGLTGHSLAPVEGRVVTAADVGKTSDLSFSLTPKDESRSLRARLVGATYGIPLAAKVAELRCGTREWTVFFHEDLAPEAISTRLGDRPWLAAILARRELDGRRAVPQQVVLTRPEPDGIRIDVARLDGTVLYTGSATPKDDALAFTLSAVERPGVAPTTIVGRIAGDGIVLESVVAAARRLTASTTAPVDFD